ncbi:pyruvate synthase subunit beta [Candidatus Dependentiae bacterium]|nr:pyruvate synthase subunit beta [Candidatus Dependentiae bacterium]
MITQITQLPDNELLLPGTRACSGCGLAIAYRTALKALGENVIITIPASCSTVLQGMYPIASSMVPILNTAFETTAASASGLSAALKVLGKSSEYTIVGWAGDGGTADIGIQALSGAAERGEDFIYVCYDNEAYMNTGTQRSGATPVGALTTTTPFSGKKQNKKDMLKIMEAHNLPYIASCSPSYPVDLFNKFSKAKNIKGTRYIHIFTPCPPGWGFSQNLTVKIGKLAVESGLFDLFEIENGKKSFTGVSKNIYEKKTARKSVTDYIKWQSRFSKISEEQVEYIQKQIDLKFFDTECLK